MKTLVLALFLYFFLFAACSIYAGNQSMTASYPAPSGSYNKLVIPTLSTAPDCSAPGNAGMLFIYAPPSQPGATTISSGQVLAMCANGLASIVGFPETCFNRFCSWADGTENPLSDSTPYCQLSSNSPFGTGFHGCPPGYTWASTTTNPMQDIFTTYADGSTYYHVETTVCCSCPTPDCLTPGNSNLGTSPTSAVNPSYSN